jgi:hypothetical protein
VGIDRGQNLLCFRSFERPFNGLGTRGQTERFLCTQLAWDVTRRCKAKSGGNLPSVPEFPKTTLEIPGESFG